MSKTSKDTRAEALPDDDLLTAELNFDASHDEDGRSDAHPHASATERNPQRAPNQSDAPGAEVMAEDRAAEHGFDDEGQPTGRDLDPLFATDTALPTKDLSSIGSGDGLDEAELAEVDPVGQRESKRLRDRIAQHARDANAFEPAEAEVQRAIRQDKRDSKP